VSILVATIAVTEARFLVQARHEVRSLKHAAERERHACSWIKTSLEALKPFPAHDESGRNLDADRMSVSFTLLTVMESTLGCGGDPL